MTDVEYDILDQAEEDYTGLYELVWWVRAHSSLKKHGEIVAWVAPAVDRLLRQGLLQLYVSQGWPPEGCERLEADLDRWLDVVSWQPTDADGWGYWVVTTDAGEQAYREEARRRVEAGYPSLENRLTPY